MFLCTIKLQGEGLEREDIDRRTRDDTNYEFFFIQFDWNVFDWSLELKIEHIKIKNKSKRFI